MASTQHGSTQLETLDAISSAEQFHADEHAGEKKHAENAGVDDEETASKRVEIPMDAFGDESNAEIQYKTMVWWQASMSRSFCRL